MQRSLRCWDGKTHLEFADALNCLIGGRGAGKTTALEFLRFGLGLMRDPKTNAQRHRGIDALVKTIPLCPETTSRRRLCSRFRVIDRSDGPSFGSVPNRLR
ncbi:AAA family ATPase [Granulicella sp. 5B5]|nr:AAA family ATPase [Granulicella sp. 5B5]